MYVGISPRNLLLNGEIIGQNRNKRDEIGIGKRIKVVEFDCFCLFSVEHKEIAGDRYGVSGAWNIRKGG